MEPALQLENEQWQRIFDAIPDPVAILDGQQRIVRVNRAMAELVGKPADECVGVLCCELVHGPAARPADCPFRPFHEEGGAHSADIHVARLDADYLVTVTPLAGNDGHRNGCVHVARDISRIKQAQRAARESESRFRDISEAAGEFLCESDCEGRIQYISDRVTDILEYRPQELLGRTVFDIMLPAEAVRIVQLFLENVQQGTGFRNQLCEFLTKSGRAVYLRITAVPRVDESGALKGYCAAVLDVTAEQQAEKKLQQTWAELTHVARLSTAGEMVAGIAHEVNQPLYSIVNYAEACNNLLAQDAPPLAQLGQWCREIAAAAARTGKIINRLREFARWSELQCEQVPLSRVIEEAVALMSFYLKSQQIALCVTPGPADPTVLIDRIQVQQVLVNLLRNACDAFASSGQAEKQLTVRSDVRDGIVTLAVSDNGPGLPDLGPLRIFEPFVTTKPQGLGMGLAISKRIVESHGGQIWAGPGAEGGATFQFTLPVAKRPDDRPCPVP